MLPLSVTEYWERLERHDWFYAWAEGSEGHDELVQETVALFAFSRLSLLHSQLYSSYHTTMYARLMLDENDNVGNIAIPMPDKPEAA